MLGYTFCLFMASSPLGSSCMYLFAATDELSDSHTQLLTYFLLIERTFNDLEEVLPSCCCLLRCILKCSFSNFKLLVITASWTMIMNFT